MKNYFHNDVDNENIEIANKIYNESKTFSKDTISIPDLDNLINKNSSERVFNKRHIFTMASVVAACFLFIISATMIPNLVNYKMRSNTASATSNPENVATDYKEIYDKLEQIALANSNNNIYDDFVITEDAESYGYTNSDVDGYTGSIPKSSAKGTGSNTEKDFYNTNEQTEKVHEADIVKTDGNYIYTLKNSNTNQIIITKVDGMNMKNVKKLTIEDNEHTDITELYLCQNRLVAIGSKWNEKDNTYTTLIYVFDIKTPKKATLIKCITQDGSYTSSRMKDNYLYTISEKYIKTDFFKNCDGAPAIDEYGCYLPMVDCCPMNLSDICIPNNPSNPSYTIVTSLDVSSPDKFITSKSVLGGSSEVYVSQDNIYILNSTYEKKDISDTKLGKEAATCYPIYDNQLVDFDNPNKTPLKITLKDTSFYAPSSNIYKYSYSEDNVIDHIEYFLELNDENHSLEDIKAYISTHIYESTTITEIIKYKYDNGNIKYVGSNKIQGHAENNLNFDEKDGYLRCVTTQNSTSYLDMIVTCYDKSDNLLYNIVVDSNNLDNTSDTNNVFVLDNNLEIKAEINNLAEGESIYSARYLGDYGYFVTYEETDPLFSVDFSNIEKPKIIGELKMPGVSEYLHFYKDNLLLGFGYEDTNDSRHLKLEMYDTSTGIAQKKSKTILDNYCYSEALYEYKAIMVDPSKNIIGFHAENYVENKDYWNNYYVVYTYDNNEFSELLKVKINDVMSEVRGFYIDDYLYIVTLDWEIDTKDNITVVNMKTYNEDQKVEKLKLK